MDASGETVLSREELYELVWMVPTSKLAERLGISDVAIGKICRKCSIPKPSLGYWAKIQSGQTPKRVRLPLPKAGAPTEISIRRTEKPDPAVPSTKVAALLEEEKTPGRQIVVQDELRSPHALVKDTRSALSRCGSDKYGRVIRPRNEPTLDIKASKESMPRALRIMDALVKALEERGYPVTLRQHYDGFKTTVDIEGELLSFRIDEPAIRSPHTPTARDKKLSFQEKWDYAATGCLNLHIDTYIRNNTKGRWRDTKSDPIEKNLNSFLAGLVLGADYLRAERVAKEHLQRKAEEQERLEKQIDAQRRQEEKHVRDLIEKARLWNQSVSIHAFLDSVEQAALDNKQVQSTNESLVEWIRWARAWADRFNPISELLRQEGTTSA